MSNIFFIAASVALVAAVIGLFSPTTVGVKNRFKAILLYGVLFFAILGIGDALTPDAVKAEQSEKHAVRAEQKAQMEAQEKQEKLQKDRIKQQHEQSKAAEQMQQYKGKAQSIPLQGLLRTPEKYKNAIVVYRGEIRQIITEDDRDVTLSIDISGNYDTIVAQYTLPKGQARILVGDVITFYGDFMGLEQYKKAIGNTVATHPLVKVRYIE